MKDDKNITALHRIVFRNNKDDVYKWVEEILKHKVDINVGGWKHKITPLMTFANRRIPSKVIKLLLEKGADPHILDKKGRHALMMAVVPHKRLKITRIDPETVQLLLDYKSNLQVKKRGWGKQFLDLMRENEEFTRTEVFKRLNQSAK